MAKELYLECYSGISGDMTVAALLDLGADRKALEEGLASLKVDGYQLHFSRTSKNGIDAFDFDVELTGEERHCHHDHEDGCEHSHVHGHGEDHEHRHEDDHGHSHVEAHTHDHVHIHSHSHRGLPEILAIIDGSEMTGRAKALAKKMFCAVAEAEGKIHGKPLDQVHFHEVGAVDSIVDIAGVAICIDNLGIEKVYCSPLYEGTGYVRCQHGLMPVPAPATAQICANYHIPMKITGNKGEMVTPTGAAIVAALADSFQLPDPFVPEKIGFGAGKKDFACANVLRAYLLEPDAGKKKLGL